MTAQFMESYHSAAFILWEEDFNYSRDNIVLNTGSGVLKTGTILAKITQTLAAGAVIAWGAGGGHGNTGGGTCTKDGTTPVHTDAMLGDYLITFTGTGATAPFNVTNPGGQIIGTGATGTTFDNEIKFMVADGSPDFIAGDGFKFPVTGVANANKYVPAVASGSDGSQIACAALIYDSDTTSADVYVSAITRIAQLNRNLLFYDASINDDNKKAAVWAQLAAVGIIVR